MIASLVVRKVFDLVDRPSSWRYYPPHFLIHAEGEKKMGETMERKITFQCENNHTITIDITIKQIGERGILNAVCSYRPDCGDCVRLAEKWAEIAQKQMGGTRQ